MSEELDRLSHLTNAIHRLASALEQYNAKPPVVGAGFVQTVGTPTGQSANVIPLRHYNEQPTSSEAQHDQQARKIRRPRQGNRGK